MRYLEHYARSVAGFVVGSFRPAVSHILQYLKGGLHYLVAFASVNVHQHAYATGVVFVRWVVQSFFFVNVHFLL